MINNGSMGGHDTTGASQSGATSDAPDRDRILFYDGDCGLCHSTVQFALKRDPQALFHYAPLQGETWARMVADYQANPATGRIDTGGIDLAAPPDSVILLREGRLLYRTPAVLSLLSDLDRPWPLIGAALGIFPRFLSDLGYRIVARVRGLLFPRPEGLCPIVPIETRARFLD